MRTSKRFFLTLFVFILTLIVGLEESFAQRSSSRRNTSRNTTTTQPRTPEVQQNTNQNAIAYDFSKLKTSDKFRKIPWGASKEQVLKSDPSTRKETGEDYLVLTDELGDYSVDITYFFWRGYFIKGTYQTTDSFNDFAGYYEQYTMFKEGLTKKYGRPRIDIKGNWSDVTYKNRPDKWQIALANGHLEYFAIWQKDNIVISIKLGSIDNSPSVKLEYYIDNFDSEMQQVDDADILEDL